MKDFKASNKLCAFCVNDLKFLFNEAGQKITTPDDILLQEMQQHIADTLDFCVTAYCKYLQYDPQKQVTLLDNDGLDPRLKQNIAEHLIYINPNQEDEFFDLLCEELRDYLDEKPNPVLSGQWGIITFKNSALNANLLLRRKRSIEDLLKPR